MEQTYSHHHVSQAHHSGLVIGTLIGSCAITAVIAIVMVVASPHLLLHPLSLTTKASATSTSSQSNQNPGPAAVSTSNISHSQTTNGPAAQAVSNFSH